MEEGNQEPIIMRHTIEHGVSEYGEMKDQFGDMFFDLEKLAPVDFSGIYIILPHGTHLKKKSVLWGFSLAKKCNSKVFLAVRETKAILEQIDKISKAFGVEYEFLKGDVEKIMEDLKKERNIIVLPRDIIGPLKEEKQEGPMLII